MLLYLLALKPTDSVTRGFLPAAARLGLAVTVLTDRRVRALRDYLGLVWALGRDPDALRRAATDFVAANRWEITP
ncbi:hypothetical protein [Streptomyces kaniharaensis]|nr:hypothetical protein [Streptomyces kaniharaensis]